MRYHRRPGPHVRSDVEERRGGQPALGALMFATLVGAYPRTPLPGRPFRLRAAYGQLERGETDAAAFRAVQDEVVREVVAEQEAAGLEPLTDGQVRWEDAQTPFARALDGFEITGLLRYFDTNTYYRQPRAVAEPRWTRPITVDAWRFASSCTERAVKQCVTGPYTLARLSDPGEVGRERLTLALAEALNQELRALAGAGCPLVQVDENAAILIGDDEAERRLFRDAQRRLLDGVTGTHRSLAITMGSAHEAGPETIFDAPYDSYLFDLCAGPDAWYLIAQAPGERGVIAGAVDARTTRPDTKEVVLWAALYAASTQGRGKERVGLSPSTGLEYLPRDRARAKIELLGETARLAALPAGEELARQLDPRALGIRAAAFGRAMGGGGGAGQAAGIATVESPAEGPVEASGPASEEDAR